MKLIKSAIVALTLLFSMGLFSSAWAVGPEQVVDMIQGKIAETVKAIDEGASADDISSLIAYTKKLAKEINVNDKAAAKTQKAIAPLKKAAVAVKKGDLEKAKDQLMKSEERWETVRKAF